MKKLTNKVIPHAAGRIWVNDFCQDAASKICAEILRVAERDETEPIILYIDSYGGDVHALASVISVVDSIPNPLITIATGKAISCGAILLSHGDIRYAGKHSTVMIHEVSSSPGYMNVNDLKIDTKETERLNDHFIGLLAANCGKSLESVRSMFKDRREIYMSPPEAMKFGIIDEIGIPLFEKHTQYAIRTVEQIGASRAKNQVPKIKVKSPQK